MKEPLRCSTEHMWNWILVILGVIGTVLWRFFGLDGRVSLALILGWILVGRVFSPWVINEHIGFLDRWVFHDYDKAHTRYRKAVDSGKASAAAYCALASLAMAEGDLPEAAMLLEEGVTRRPRDYYAYSLLARVLSRLGRHEEALAAAIRVQEITHKSPWAHVILGDVLKGKGEYTAALSSYQKALEAGINVKEAYLGMAEIYLDDGKIDETERLLEKAHEKYPQDPDVAYWLGRLFLAKKDREAAKNYLKLALERRPPRDKSYRVPYKDVVKSLSLCNIPTEN